jgi:hypothetical protein
MLSPKPRKADGLSTPYEGFRQGLCRTHGSCIDKTGDRVSLLSEPWVAESDQLNAVPGLRLDFRKAGERFILERFAV